MRTFEIEWRNGDVSIDATETKTSVKTVDINGQLLDVVQADGSTEGSDRPTILWPQAFMARAQDPIEKYRIQLLAARLQTKVISVDRPGMRYDPVDKAATDAGKSNLRGILKAAALGNLDDVSATQLQAVNEAGGISHGGELHLMGYSFGAWSASSMARVLGKEPFGSNRQPVLSGITLLEAANDQPRSMRAIQGSLANDSSTENISRYLLHNEELGAEGALFFDWESATKRSEEKGKIHKTLDKKQALSLYVPALGMRKGFASNLAASAAMGFLDDTKVTLVRANGSLVARRSAHKQTVAEINGAYRGSAIAELVELTPANNELPHRHPMAHSMGIMAVFADTIVAKYPDMAR